MLKDELTRRVDPREYFGLFVGGLIGAAAIAFSISRNPDNYPVSHVLTSWFVSLAIGVIFHEWGHAVAFVAMGGSVDSIQLGQRYRAKPLWTFRLLGFWWHLYSVPMSGLVHGHLYDVRHYRLRRCVAIAGGPLVNAIFAGVALILINTTVFDWSTAFLMGWIGANGLIFLGSVIPMRGYLHGKVRPNDGILFYEALRYTDIQIAQFIEGANLQRRLGKDAEIAASQSLEDVYAHFMADPANIGFGAVLLNKMHEENDPRYLECVLKVLEYPRLAPSFIVSIIDSYLTWQLNRGPSDRPEIANQLSSRLIAEDKSISVRGTRGSVLIDLGCLDEGKAMLEEVLARTTSPFDKTYAQIFLALAAQAEGDLVLARNYAQKAKKINSTCPALPRVSDLLKS